MNGIIFHKIGIGTSLQDLGRKGYLQYGVAPSGVMDEVHYAHAIRLIGGKIGDAVIEIGIGGLEIEAIGRLNLVVSAPIAEVQINGESYIAPMRFSLEDGMRAKIRLIKGRWGYLALGTASLENHENQLEHRQLEYGQWWNAQQKIMGSLSSHSRYDFLSPIQLKEGLMIKNPSEYQPINKQFFSSPFQFMADIGLKTQIFDLLPASHYELFSSKFLNDLTRYSFAYGKSCDRMAYEIYPDQPLKQIQLPDLPSEATQYGALQLIGGTQPYILAKDRQTTGGYVKPALIASADMAMFSQAITPYLRFRWIDLVQAQAKWQKIIKAIEASLHPSDRPIENSKLAQNAANPYKLWQENLISGIYDGT